MLLLNAYTGITCRGEDYFDELGRLLAKALNAYNSKFLHEGHWASNTNSCRFHRDDLNPLLRYAVLRLLARDLPKETRRVGSKFRQLPLSLRVFTESLFPRSPIVHILRDPRDVIVSVFYFNRRNNPEKARQLEPTLTDAVRRLLPIWTNTVTTLETFGNTHPDRYIRIRYEDLVTEPVEPLTQVLRALNIPPTPDAITSAVAATQFSRLSGGRKRGQEQNTSFFRRGEAGGWRQAFGETEIAAFEALADKTLLKDFGYQ